MSTFKPGPNNQGFVILPPDTGGGGIAVEIQQLTDPGTSGALAVVAELDPSGIATSRTYSGVYILPYGQFAELGDKGIMAAYAPTSGVATTTRYVQINKSVFLKYD